MCTRDSRKKRKEVWSEQLHKEKETGTKYSFIKRQKQRENIKSVNKEEENTADRNNQDKEEERKQELEKWELL